MTTDSFSFTGSVQNWVCPPGITSAIIDAVGAGGGLASLGTAIPGKGGRTRCRVNGLTPGATYKVYVGGKGGNASGITGGASGSNSGRTAKGGRVAYYGGGGGGSTDFRTGTDENDRIVVAPGGGGAGAKGTITPGGGANIAPYCICADLPNAVLYTWGGGTNITSVLAIFYPSDGSKYVFWDPTTIAPVSGATGTRGTVWSVCVGPSNEVFVTLDAYKVTSGGTIISPTQQGIYRLSSSGALIQFIQLAGYSTIYQVTADCEKGLWAYAIHTATNALHLVRFSPAGAVLQNFVIGGSALADPLLTHTGVMS